MISKLTQIELSREEDVFAEVAEVVVLGHDVVVGAREEQTTMIGVTGSHNSYMGKTLKINIHDIREAIKISKSLRVKVWLTLGGGGVEKCTGPNRI